MMKSSNSKMLWSIAFILMGLIVIDHLLVLTSFIVASEILPFVFPISFLVSVLMSLWLGNKSESSLREFLWPIVVSSLMILFSLAFSAFYFDLSWDGQWYDQAAIYQIKRGWNPIYEPLKTFNGHND